MASAQLQPCISFTLKEEGGYQANPRDAGNWTGGEVGVGRLIGTNMGVSTPTLMAWVGKAHAISVTQVFMKNLPKTTAIAIYAAYFWRPLSCDALPAGVDLAVFDFAVPSGPARSAKLLQEIVGVTPDGDIGPITLAAVAKADPKTLVTTIVAAQKNFYRTLSSFPDFGKGWLARADRRQATALGMIS